MADGLRSVDEDIRNALTMLKFAGNSAGMTFAAIDARFELGRK
jgi:hypothetical protein